MSTREKLANALSEAQAPRAMVVRARAGKYDDYLSDSQTPIMDLVRDARREGLPGIAEKAMDGEFDSTKEEADAWESSPEEGQATLRG